MMSTLAQLLMLHGRPNKIGITAAPPPVYRPYCPDCNDEGRDARHPCPGH